MAKKALIVVDMLSLYDHPDAELLRRSVRDVLPNVRRMIERARASDVAVIYVNDNFGLWRSHHDELLDIVLSGPHAELVEPVRPQADSLFVVKTRHSIFYDTPLEYLLGRHGIDSVLLCGQVTEQCILYSALDAHIRHLDVVVAEDACASIHSDLAAAALQMMERNMQARVVRSTDDGLF
ncbi:MULTISPECIES: isochorismatase family cysteine hydrolase [unclassified Streptomyces]|uniref:isochorismatase family cysteine hydrolase n=1 Tax=unclassified Streptomyces TaxID=2593676 RepID=UPI003818090F